MLKKQLLVLATALVIFGCIKKNNAPKLSPEETVRQFVQMSASAKEPEDRKKLQALTANEMWRTLERLGESGFKMIYLDSKLTIKKLEITGTQPLTADHARVQYRVTVDNQQGTDPTLETNEREVDMIKDKDVWLIQAIRTRGTDRIAFTRGMLF